MAIRVFQPVRKEQEMDDDKKKVEEIIDDENKDLTDEDVTTDPQNEDPNVEKSNEDDNPEGNKKPDKTKQSREENARFAELRRKNAELEKKNKELEAEATKASFNAKKEGITKETLASVGLDAIETESELILAKAYEKAIADGSEEPLKDALKAQRDYNRQEAEKTRTKTEQENAIKQAIIDDQLAFKKKFGIETSAVYGKDERFMKIFGDLLKPGNFTSLYEKYKGIFPDEEGEDEETAKGKGTFPTPQNKAPKKQTKKELHELDDDEFLAAWNKKYEL